MLSLSSAERAQLASATDRAVKDSLDGTLTGWKGHAPKNEPDAVAAVVSAGMPAAVPGWTSVLRPRRLSAQIIGVFCHQTPKVDFVDAGGAWRSCELADLLIVVDEAGVAANVRDRRALLVQAKIAHRPALALSGGDLVQFELLSRWPAFKFSAALYPNNWRDIRGAGTPPGLSDSACYGAIDLLPKMVQWEQLAVASLTIGSGRSFGETMADMSAGLDGREAIPGGADDWSDTIDELLRTTYQAIAGGFAGSPQRGVTSIAFMAPPTGIGVAFHPPGGGSPPGRGERQDGPISVVHVRLERNEDD